MTGKGTKSSMWTILGEKSFIGRHIAYALFRSGEEVSVPNRKEINSLTKRKTDILIYCLGIIRISLKDLLKLILRMPVF